MKESVSYAQIQSSLGSLIMLWSNIERTVREEVASAHHGQLPKSAHGIAAVLNAWEAVVRNAHNASPFRTLLALSLRAQLQDHLDVRNGVCHGLVGISASYDNRPATLTWELNDKTRSITWQELQVNFSFLSKAPRAIQMISKHGREVPGSRLIDSPETRKWWRSEYGLELLDAG